MAKKTAIQTDTRNVRIHSPENKSAIRKSLETLGAGRSIVTDSENNIIAGNGVFEQAIRLGIPIRVIESTGRELIAIKRTDLKTDSDKRKALAVADNQTGDLSEFDDKALTGLIDEIEGGIRDMAGLVVPGIEGAGAAEKPDVEFTQEVMEQNNFDNLLDWYPLS